MSSGMRTKFMDAVRKRIKKEIDARDLDFKQVSLELGKSHSYIQQYLKRRIPAKLSEDVRLKLSELLDIPEAELGGVVRRSAASTPIGDVAHLDIRAGMGNGGALSVMVDDAGTVVDPGDNGGFWSFPDTVKANFRQLSKTYAMPVTGDSMEPTLPGGSVVFVDTSHVVPVPSDIYACDYGHGLVIKRLDLIPKTDEISVISDNDRYPSHQLLRDDVRVYGRVAAFFNWRD